MELEQLWLLAARKSGLRKLSNESTNAMNAIMRPYISVRRKASDNSAGAVVLKRNYTSCRDICIRAQLRHRPHNTVDQSAPWNNDGKKQQLR
jgi:hypothetical protein